MMTLEILVHLVLKYLSLLFFNGFGYHSFLTASSRMDKLWRQKEASCKLRRYKVQDHNSKYDRNSLKKFKITSMASNNSSEMKPLKGGTKMPKSKLNLHPSEKERAQELRDLTDKKNFKLYNTAKGIFYLFVSLYGLHYWEVYHNLIYHPEVRHAWVKLTVALSIAILGKLYLLHGVIQLLHLSSLRTIHSYHLSFSYHRHKKLC